MNKRNSFEEIYMHHAFMLASRSTCERLQVGCVITTTDYRRVLGSGYNGNASGLSNSCDQNTPGNCGCIHAEQNAIINCYDGRLEEKNVFITHLPCVMCAKSIINLGNVKNVIYDELYRIKDSIEILHAANIQVIHFPRLMKNDS